MPFSVDIASRGNPCEFHVLTVKLKTEAELINRIDKEEDLDDIIEVIKKTPKHKQPIFVGRNWRKMPHAKAECDAAQARKNRDHERNRFQFPIRETDEATAPPPPQPLSATISTSVDTSSFSFQSFVYTEIPALSSSTAPYRARHISHSALISISAPSSYTPKVPMSAIIEQPSKKSALCKVIGSSKRPKASVLPSTTATCIRSTTRKTSISKEFVVNKLLSSFNSAAMQQQQMTSVIPTITSKHATSVAAASPVWLGKRPPTITVISRISANCVVSMSCKVKMTSRVQSTFKTPITSEMPMNPTYPTSTFLGPKSFMSSGRQMHPTNREYREQIPLSQFRPIETPMQRYNMNPHQMVEPHLQYRSTELEYQHEPLRLRGPEGKSYKKRVTKYSRSTYKVIEASDLVADIL
ncbi:hypothetical protein SFRURICE_011028 [Spodoptera frugiperda]|nr:hypothetical protein SFRURICE_011028 [Spodoptera frugiperda]